MPSFCRHGRFIEKCPICNPPAAEPAAPARRASPGGGGATRAQPGRPRVSSGGGPRAMRVRRVAVGEDDGYEHALLPGLRSSIDALRLADELTFAAGRLVELAVVPPGLYAEVASSNDPEEAIWLAFQIALLSPLDGVDDPFAGIAAVRTTWASGELPPTEGASVGARSTLASGGAGGAARDAGATLAGYRAFVERAGSQVAALHGEDFWKPDRRFARAFERLGLPGLDRAARFDFLSLLGAVGRVDVRAGSLHLGAGADVGGVAAKRAFGIGDPLLIDRRATALSEETGVPLEAVELGLWSWQQGARASLGATAQADDAEVRARVGAVLGV